MITFVHLGIHLNQKCQLDQFNIKCDFLEDSDLNKLKYRFTEPQHAEFYPQVFDVVDDTDLFGYFQNYRYFSKYEKEIRYDLKINTELEEQAKDYINNFKKLEYFEGTGKNRTKVTMSDPKILKILASPSRGK